jgi:ketosteroid isomerase-like protein
MKQFTLLATAIFFLVSCTQLAGPEEAKELDEVAKQNVEVVKKLLNAFENEDIPTILELFPEGAVIHGPMHDFYDTVDDGFSEGIEKWLTNVDSLKFDVISILPQSVEEGDLAGDWALLWCYESWYVVETGKHVKIMWHAPMQIEDGKIVFMASYWNQWDMFKQQGAELKWPEKEKEEE